MVNGDTIITKPYYDEETQKMINIELSVRDHLFFRLIQQLTGALRHK